MSTVVTQPYSTAGIGGRKLVKLSNGWLVAAVKNTTSSPPKYSFYVSKDGGHDWDILCTTIGSTNSSMTDAALVSYGTRVYVTITNGGLSGSNSVESWYTSFDATLMKGDNVLLLAQLDKQISYGIVSLAINPQGTELHATWASKNITYPNSFNIRYAKGTINADGSVTWGAVEQVTTFNNADYNVKSPSIVYENGTPSIFVDYSFSNNNSIWQLKRGNTLSTHNNVNSSWTFKNVHVGGVYAQYAPSAVVDKDSVIHVVWYGYDSTDVTTYNIRYSKSLDGGVTWTTSIKLTSGNTHAQRNATITTDRSNVIHVLFSGYDEAISTTALNVRKITLNGSSWSPITTLTGNTIASKHADYPSTLYDPTFAGVFGDTPPTIYMDAQKGSVEYVGTYATNNAPTVTLTSPSANQTLYENDMLNIAGTAYDPDADQSVTVYYQINNEPRKVLATNLSQKQISLSKQLTFKGSKLFDGEVAITGVLADGVAHTLKVWAVDNEGGQSTPVERTFYVVPNRAPLLSVEPPTPSGIIDADSFTINGLYEDSDGNQTTVSYRTNGSNAIQVASGVNGSFSFEVKLGSLIVGDNVITVEAVDSYGAKTTKSVKLSKSIVSAPLLTSTARYKITPPTGTASEILVWIQHDAELTLSASVSMTIAGEQESYAPMTPSNSETLQSGQVEDEFYYAADGAKDSIILRLDLTKSNVNTNEAITLITGVF